MANMHPELRDEEFVFVSVSEDTAATRLRSAIFTFRESEGVTLVLSREEAEKAGLAFTYPCRMITLTVHSSLEAVGFLAAITNMLAKHGISVNPVSAYHHDHLFVPADRAEEALALLRSTARDTVAE